jgi:hypothetical protein
VGVLDLLLQVIRHIVQILVEGDRLFDPPACVLYDATLSLVVVWALGCVVDLGAAPSKLGDLELATLLISHTGRHILIVSHCVLRPIGIASQLVLVLLVLT